MLGAHIHQAGAQKGIESHALISATTSIAPPRNCTVSRSPQTACDGRPAGGHKFRGQGKGRADLWFRALPGSSSAGQGRSGSWSSAGMARPVQGRTAGQPAIRSDRGSYSGAHPGRDRTSRVRCGHCCAGICYSLDKIVSESAGILSVQQENLPSTVARFFDEWKDQKKTIERLSQNVVDLEVKNIEPEMINGIPVVVKRIDLPPRDMAALAASVSARGRGGSPRRRVGTGPRGPHVRDRAGRCRRDYRPGLRVARRKRRGVEDHGTGRGTRSRQGRPGHKSRKGQGPGSVA